MLRSSDSFERREYTFACPSCQRNVALYIHRWDCGLEKRAQCSSCSCVYVVDIPLGWWEGLDWLTV